MDQGSEKRRVRRIDTLLTKYRSKIREKAIDRAKTRIVLHGRKVSDYDSDELEILVREEEDKIKQSLKERGFLAALALVGLNSF